MALTKTQVSELYVAIFNRASEGSGNTYWQNTGLNAADMANEMLATSDAQSYFGSSLDSNQAFIEHIYSNTLNKTTADDADGIAYWVNLLDSGASRGEVVTGLIDAVSQYENSTDANTQAAYDQFMNRVAVSDYMADKVEDTPVNYGTTTSFSGSLTVTDVSSSYVDAISAINDMADVNTTGVFTITAADTTTVVTEASEKVLMWGYTPDAERTDGASQGVEAADLVTFLTETAGIDLHELGLIDDDGIVLTDQIQNITIGDITNTTTGTITINTTDGQELTAEADLGENYMDFLSDLLFDANGDSRLYYETTAGSSTTTTEGPVVLTTTVNNGRTFESGVTTAADDTIVVEDLSLLDDAYIDGGEGHNTLEIDTAGSFAKPIQLLNIQEVKIQNTVDDDASTTTTANSIVDLSRATDLETLTISEGYQTDELGSLIVGGVRNNADLVFNGSFDENVTVNYAYEAGDAIDITFNVGNVNSAFNIIHNNDTVNIDSIGTSNTFGTLTLGTGSVQTLNISGTAKLNVTENISGSFALDHDVVIDASANTAGVDLTLTPEASSTFENLTITTTAKNDDLVVSNADELTINAGEGDNEIEVTSTETATITAGNGDNEIEVTSTETATITAGNGDNTITSVADTVSITTGTGADTIEVTGNDVSVVSTGGNNTITVVTVDNADVYATMNLNIDAGTDASTVIIGTDDEAPSTPTEFGVILDNSSSISGTDVTLSIMADSDISQATLTGITSVALDEDNTVTLTAAQFIALGTDAFSAQEDYFGVNGAQAQVNIVITEDLNFDDLGDMSLFDCDNINLTFTFACDDTLTLTAEQLHMYVASNGITITEAFNGNVVITDAALDFDEENGDGGTIGSNIDDLTNNVEIVRDDIDGYSRPVDNVSTDTLVIDSTDAAVIVSSDIESDLTTLNIIGTNDVTFEDGVVVDLGENFTIDFSDLTGNLSGLTITNFEEITTDPIAADVDDWGMIIGNDAVDTRIDLELSEDAVVGYDDNANGGFKSSGVEEYVVTELNGGISTIYVCDNTEDVEVLGLQGNGDGEITFGNVKWDVSFLLEGDAAENWTDRPKADGSPDESNIGTVHADFFYDGAPAVFNINNQGVALGTTSTGTDRPLVVAGIETTNANSVTINVTDGDVVITDITDNTSVETLTVNSANDVEIVSALTTALTTIDFSGVAGTVDVNMNSMDDAFTLTSGAGDTTITLNEDFTAQDGTVIDGTAGTTSIVIANVDTANTDIDLSDVTLTSIESIVIDNTDATPADDTTLTLSIDQINTVGLTNITATQTDDTASDYEDATLNIVDMDDSIFDITPINDGISLGTVTMAEGTWTLNAATDLTGATSIIVPEGGSLTLTADQYMALADGTITTDNLDPDVDTTVIITGLTQAHIDAGFTLTNVAAVGLNGTVELAESLNLTADIAGTTALDPTDLNGFAVTMSDTQVLGLATSTQADGLEINGTGDTTVELQFNSMDGGDTNGIDTEGYTITTLKALDTFVGGQNVEDLIENLDSSVTLFVTTDPEDLSIVQNTDRVVIVEEGVTVAGGLMFNDLNDGQELTSLTLTLQGDNTITGDISVPTLNTATGYTGVDDFQTMTILSEGTANIITGNITAETGLLDGNGTGSSTTPGSITAEKENDLLNIAIIANADLTIGSYDASGTYTPGSNSGDIIFSDNDDTGANSTATLTVTGTANVTMHGVDSSDTDITTVAIVNNSTGTLTMTGGSEAISANDTETITFLGTGDIVLGSDGVNGTVGDGVDSTTLSTIDASGLSGDLTLDTITNVDSTDFSLTAGSGVTTATLTTVTLAADADGIDNIAGNADDEAGFNIDMSNAAAGSELHLGSNTYTSGDLNINLGANTTLYIDADTNWTLLDSVTISQTTDIVLADGVSLTLTAEQANGLNIIGVDSNLDGTFGTVNISQLGDTAVDLSGISADIAGTTILEDDDVTLDATTNLGDFSVTLIDLADSTSSINDDLVGQTIRFTTEEQAGREINVAQSITAAISNGTFAPVLGTNDDDSTNVVWLFENITSSVDTSAYDSNIARLWLTAELLANNNDVEDLFTTLPNSILRVDFSTLTELNLLLASTAVNRTIELVHFTEIPGGLVFDDSTVSEHVESLTVNMGGEVNVGDITLGNIIDNSAYDNSNFTTLEINSELATMTGDLLAAEDYVNDNGIDDISGENVAPVSDATHSNVIGDISVGGTDANIDLTNVDLNATGSNLTVGTITFDAETAGTTVTLDVTGTEDVTIASLNTTDADISTLTVTNSGTGSLTVTGASPAAAVSDTEILNIEATNALSSVTLGTAGDATKPGVSGAELSEINLSGAGDIDLGVIASVDGVAQVDANTGDPIASFVLDATSATGVVSAIFDGPVLQAGAVWGIDLTGAAVGSTVTLKDTTTFNATNNSLLAINMGANATLVIDGDIDLSAFADNALTTTITEGLLLNGTVEVLAGSTLTLTAEQASQSGLTFTGAGTVELVGDAEALDISGIVFDANWSGVLDGSSLDSINGTVSDINDAYTLLTTVPNMEPTNFNSTLADDVAGNAATDIITLEANNGTGTIDGSALTTVNGTATDILTAIADIDTDPVNFDSTLTPESAYTTYTGITGAITTGDTIDFGPTTGLEYTATIGAIAGTTATVAEVQAAIDAVVNPNFITATFNGTDLVLTINDANLPIIGRDFTDVDNASAITTHTDTLANENAANIVSILAVNGTGDIDASDILELLGTSADVAAVYANSGVIDPNDDTTQVNLSGVQAITLSDDMTVAQANVVTAAYNAVLTATIVEQDMATLNTLITDPNADANALTITVADANVDAAALNTLNAKTSVSIDATAVTSITGIGSDIATAVTAAGINDSGTEAITVDSGNLTVADQITIDGATTGVITATIDEGDMITLAGIADANANNVLTVVITDTQAVASALNTLDGKTTVQVDATALTSIIGDGSYIATAVTASGILTSGNEDISAGNTLDVADQITIDGATTGIINATITEGDMATLANLTDANANNALTVTVTDPSVDAAALNTLDGKTLVPVTVTSGTLTGTAATVQAAYAAYAAGTITGLGDEAIIISDAGSIAASVLNALSNVTSGAITTAGITEITGTQAEVQAALGAANLVSLAAVNVIVSDPMTAAQQATMDVATTGIITAAISDNDMATLANLTDANGNNALTVTVTDPSVDAAALNTLDGKTSVPVTVTSTTLTGVAIGGASDVIAAYAANAAGTIIGLGDEAVTLAGSGESVSDINTITGDTTGVVTATVAPDTISTLNTLTSANSDMINVETTDLALNASEVLALDGKTGSAVDVASVTTLTGLSTDVIAYYAADTAGTIASDNDEDVLLLNSTITATDLSTIEGTNGTSGLITSVFGSLDITDLSGVSVAATNADDTFVFTGAETNVAITGFVSGTDLIDVFAIDTTPGTLYTGIDHNVTENIFFFLSTGIAGDADTLGAAANAINSADQNSTWGENLGDSAYFAIADDDSTTIYHYEDVDGTGITAGELTIVGTIDTDIVNGDIA
ncbi:DUF4214 domain-containing protein [Poseidonibacter antarcticus]|uniref:DUF4214 domain-containing protein n=1 Tax=Poseidonibacter antarcticus TaxID=2478538 RepID=UPI000EF48F1B|nr:DUF4214 domain-containing protein [Poseidonibacter antarcticus]